MEFIRPFHVQFNPVLPSQNFEKMPKILQILRNPGSKIINGSWIICSSVIATGISGNVLRNMACAELGESGPRNSRRERESRRT